MSLARLTLAAVLVVSACKGSSEPPAEKQAKAEAPAASPAAQLCQRTLDALTASGCKDPAFSAARVSLESTLRTLARGVDEDAKQYDLVCARVFAAIEHDTKSRCPLAVDAELRQRLDKTLGAYFAIRTAIAPTGDAATDAVIQKLGAIRDEACACTDQPCLDALNAKLPDLAVDPKTPDAAKQLASGLLADVLRCQERLKLAAP